MGELKIGVVGAGSIGSVVATILSEKGYDLEMVYNHSEGKLMNNFVNMDIIGEFGEHSFLVKSVDKIEDFSSKKDIIFITTRANSIAECTKQAVPYLTENGIIIVSGNVLTYQDIRQYLPLSRVVSFFVEWTANRINPSKIEVVSNGNSVIGIYDEYAKPFLNVVKSILKLISNVETCDNMLEFTLSRIVLNSAIASIGAISGLTLAEFLSDKNGKMLFEELIKESVATFNALNIKIEPYDDHLDYYEFCDNERYRNKFIKLMKKNNPHLVSSMLTDLENGRKTEVDYLIGKICRLAKVKNLEVPYSNRVYKMIKQIEKGERTIYPESLIEVFEPNSFD